MSVHGVHQPALLDEVRGNVLILTLNRPEKLNSLDSGLVDALHAALDVYENRPDVHAVVITGAGGGTAQASTTVNVANAALTATKGTATATEGSSFTAVIAHFTDANSAAVAGDFAASINWGDGTTASGTVSGGAGSFAVSGTHTYTAGGSFAVIVTLADLAPEGVASAVVMLIPA